MNADDLAKILDELGQRLGPTGERVFGLAVQYKVTSSLIGLLASLVGLAIVVVVVVIAARWSFRRWRAECQKYADGKGKWSSIQSTPDVDDFLFPWVFGGIGAALAAAVLVALVLQSVTTLLNPEYSALRELIGQIR